METIVLEFPAGQPAAGRAVAGVVASGDLEVLLEANAANRTVVNITTSVDGMGRVWQRRARTHLRRRLAARRPARNQRFGRHAGCRADAHRAGLRTSEYHRRSMTIMDTQQLLERQSFIELDARSRAKKLLDEGTFSELLDPFERVRSPWLALQGIVTQADDGIVVAKGKIDGQPAVVLAIDGGFQGGSMGEVVGGEDRGQPRTRGGRQPQRHPDARRDSLRDGWRALAGSESRARGDRGDSRRHRRFAALSAGDRHHGRADRLLSAACRSPRVCAAT